MGVLKIVMDNNELKEPKFNYKAELLKLVSDIDLVNDYIAVGKTMKRTPTKTGLNLFVKECDKYHLSYELAMTIVIDKNWRGFNYLWLKEEDFEKYGLRKKQQVKKEKPITMAEVQNLLSEEEKTNAVKKQINESYIAYMDDLINPSFPSQKFDFLVEQNLISVEEKMANYYAKKRVLAIDYLRKKYNPDLAITREEKLKFRQALDLIDADKSPLIDIKIKELVLLEFFDSKIKSGTIKIFDL